VSNVAGVVAADDVAGTVVNSAVLRVTGLVDVTPHPPGWWALTLAGRAEDAILRVDKSAILVI
jgi:hypothetical protein